MKAEALVVVVCIAFGALAVNSMGHDHNIKEGITHYDLGLDCAEFEALSSAKMKQLVDEYTKRAGL